MGRCVVVWGALLCLTLSGCHEIKRLEKHDPALDYTRQQYEEKLTGKGDESQFAALPPRYIPPQREGALPSSMGQPVSITATESIPLKDLLMSLARQAKVNIAIANDVGGGGVNFYAQKQPVLDVVSEICSIANLRYKVDRNTIRIEQDTPYMKTYNLQFFSSTRHQRNRISMATDVFTTLEGYNREFDNGSSTLLTSDSKIDFWTEFEANLARILGYQKEGEGNAYTLNKIAGLVSIYGTSKQHELIQKYIQDILYSTQLQVLIEAKIVEVNLKDEYQTGINWHRIKGDFFIDGALGDIAKSPSYLNPQLHHFKNVFTIGSASKTLTALASILSTFGTVRTLSSPRVTVLNNQTAILKVATNQVFFRVQYYRESGTNENPPTERASSQIQTVPIGLVMVVHPSVEVETGRILLTIRPTISRVIDEVEDPAALLLSAQGKGSKVPVVQVREMDSVLKMENGSTVVMGGLMEDRSDDSNTGVPGAKEIPLLGNLFKAKEHNRKTTELVIFIRATVLQNPIIESHDREVYKNFTQDPRPLQMTTAGS